MLKHIADAFNENINMVLASDGSNKSAFYCADVVGSRKFVMNYGGYPRSEIAELNDMTNVAQMEQLLHQLGDYSPSSNPNAGKTDAEIMLGHKSKHLQTPSEVISWLEGQLHERDVARQALESKNPETIEFKSNEEVVENV